jgi:non-heme chloroperoxidase
MPYITVGSEKNNKIKLSYADYGEGKPVVLIHGWPTSHRMWEKQIIALVEAGYRVIAYDRRGFGESYKPWNGYDYDTLTEDLNILLTELELKDVTLVGFSMGGGEVARYIGTHGTDRIAKVVLLNAILPYLPKNDDNPEGIDQSVFDGMMHDMAEDRPNFVWEFNKMFVNWNEDGKDLMSEKAFQHSWDIGVWSSPRATHECAKAFSTTDFRNDVTKFNVPTLILHGGSDKITPLENTGKRTHEMIDGSELVVIENGSHGMTTTHADQVNKILIDFLNK